MLRSQGYADAQPGASTIVRSPKAITAGADRFQRIRQGGDIDAGERVEMLGAGTERAPQEVADALGLDEGDEVAWRRRRYVDTGGVVAVSTTWVSRAVADAAPGVPARRAVAQDFDQ